MEEKKFVPKRRFRGFEKKWSQKKFGELVDRVSTTEKDISLPQVEFEDIISGEGRFNKDIFQKKIDKTGIKFKEDDILFGKLRPYLKNWLLASFEGLAIGDFWVFRSKVSDSKFIYFMIQTQRYQSIANLTIGTKMPRSDWYTVSNTNFNVPINKEQQKIGAFFKVLDERIANQKRKIAKVKALKAAYLTEMFPQEGETAPKRRFKGFEGEWVVRELSDIVYKAVDNRGKTPPLNKKGIHPIIEVMSLGNRKPYYTNVEKYIDEFTYNNFLRDYVKENDILFSTVGRIGVVSMMDSNQYATIAQNIVGFRAKENYSPNFLYALFSNKLNFKRVNKIVMGAVQPSVKVSELIKVNYLVSSNIG